MTGDDIRSPSFGQIRGETSTRRRCFYWGECREERGHGLGPRLSPKQAKRSRHGSVTYYHYHYCWAAVCHLTPAGPVPPAHFACVWMDCEWV